MTSHEVVELAAEKRRKRLRQQLAFELARVLWKPLGDVAAELAVELVDELLADARIHARPWIAGHLLLVHHRGVGVPRLRTSRALELAATCVQVLREVLVHHELDEAFRSRCATYGRRAHPEAQA